MEILLTVNVGLDSYRAIVKIRRLFVRHRSGSDCTESVCYVSVTSQYNAIQDDRILESSELKDFADDNFKFDENGRKVSKPIENIVGK